MIAVIFEAFPTEAGKVRYLSIAASLREYLKDRPGFISLERFQSLGDENKVLSLSFWENEEAIQVWRNLFEHRISQKKGRSGLFATYRIRVAHVLRDYTKSDRTHAPSDSNVTLGWPEVQKSLFAKACRSIDSTGKEILAYKIDKILK